MCIRDEEVLPDLILDYSIFVLIKIIRVLEYKLSIIEFTKTY